MPAPPSQIFTGRMPFLPPNQQRQSTIHAPKIEVYGGYHPLNGEWQQKEPQKAHVYAENIMWRIGRQQRDAKYKKGRLRNQKHATCQVFAETTHIVHCHTDLHVTIIFLGFIKIHSGVLEPPGI